MADHHLSDDEQLTDDIYDQLSHRYTEDPESLDSYEKMVLMIAAISLHIDKVKRRDALFAEVVRGFQARCDQAKAYLDRVERGQYEGDINHWIDGFWQILPNRMHDDCLSIDGLGDILQQYYNLNGRACDLEDKLSPLQPVPVGWGASQARVEAERQILIAEGRLSGIALESAASARASLRRAMGDAMFNQLAASTLARLED